MHECDKDPCLARFDKIDQKLDKISNKLDNHLERIAKAEVWIKGHTTVIGFIVTAFLAVATKLLMR
jgi:hypothetical protein